MREFEDDPQYVFAVNWAAFELLVFGYGDPQMEVALLRAARFGFRETENLLQGKFKKHTTAQVKRQNILRCRKGAGICKAKADKLCKKIGLPFLHQGDHENTARVLWFAFRDLRLAVPNWRTCWLLITLGWEPTGATRDGILEKLEEEGADCFIEDKEVFFHASEAGRWIWSLVNSYSAAQAKAKLH